ncbi:DNA polymerase III subunit delta [Pontixanthobacter aestiaquae]|uniref:DNA-directed DNA polymerase n=1 Tax=Pontixanthobacter aestiaquae TaxID=1509367 RepID=A0A844Z3G7_9SPHN|nr:DNA polymerase III subunit delta [Pontixanthobacter aestiaquae]MDN3646739.1 DNA polymerase III subunit delta [Pontixanthobacter aestiaquae]MXO82278.1 DNA polymerase III subunit delta [Pontixanthobacter aestiaquae]
MKATQKDFGSLARRAANECSVFYFCGPDEAGASAAAQTIISMLDDPGERMEMAGATLRKDPILLGDEARAGSLFGDSKHIVVRASGDEALDAVGNHLLGTGDACPVLIVATSATDKSRTAKLLEKRDDALVAMFWPPDLGSVAGSVRTMADTAGLQLNGDIAERIARGAGLDVRLAQSEIEKIALYLDASPESPRNVDVAVLDAIGAKTEDDGFMPVVNAVLSGETNKLQAELVRVRELAINPVGLLLAFERRAAQLASLSAKIGPRGDINGVIQSEKRARRIFWKDERDLSVQLRRWRGKKLDRLLSKLLEMHRALLSNSQSADLLLSQGLTEIARAAAPRR